MNVEINLNTILITITLIANMVYMFIVRTRFEREKVDEQKKQRKLKEKELEENGIDVS